MHHRRVRGLALAMLMSAAAARAPAARAQDEAAPAPPPVAAAPAESSPTSVPSESPPPPADWRQALDLLAAPGVPWDRRRQAAQVAAAGGPAALPALLALLTAGEPEARLAARHALAALGEPAAAALRRQAALAEGAEARAAVEALGDFGARALPAAAALERRRTGDDPAAAALAQRALLRIGRSVGVEDDLLERRDGQVLRGVVLETGPAAVKFAVVKRAAGKTSVYTVTVPRPEIARLQPAPAEQAPFQRARLAAYQDAQSGFPARRRALAPQPARDEDGGAVQQVETDQFRLHCRGPAEFAAEAAVRLDAIFRAYEDAFRLPVAPGLAVGVRIFDARADYEAWQRRHLGTTVLNPACYVPARNEIIGFCELERWQRERAEATARHQQIGQQIDRRQAQIKGWRRRLDHDLKNARAAVLAETQRRRDATRGQPARAAAETRKKADQWQRDQLADLDRQAKEIRAQLATAEDALQADERAIADAERKNAELLAALTRDMYDTLAHEAFHAFAATRLFPPQAGDARWLNEGLAMYFEAARFDGVDLTPGAPNEDWIRALQARLTAGALPALPALLAGAQEDFVVQHRDQAQRSNDFYYLSWYLVRLLGEERRLEDPRALAAFVVADAAAAALAGEPPAAPAAAADTARLRAFETLVGEPPDRLWARLVRQLREDDAAWYDLIRLRPGALGEHAPGPQPRVRARVVARLGDRVRLRLRDGTVVECASGDLIEE